MRLRGVLAPLTTPFRDGRASPAHLEENVEKLGHSGLEGFVLLGSTGETAYLEEAEKVELMRSARRAVPEERTLVVGVGLESTPATIRMAQIAGDHGADLALVLTPSYFRSRMTADVLVRHFTAVADASPIPVLLYNVPMFTGLAIPPEAVEELSAHPNIAGMKDSSGDVGWMLDVRSRAREGFAILGGSAFAFQPVLAAGAVGGILAVANAIPEIAVSIDRLQRRGASGEALAVQLAILPTVRLLQKTYGVAGIKAAMDHRGAHGGPCRAPLLPLAAEARRRVETEIERLVDDGLLPRLRLQ